MNTYGPSPLGISVSPPWVPSTELPGVCNEWQTPHQPCAGRAAGQSALTGKWRPLESPPSEPGGPRGSRQRSAMERGRREALEGARVHFPGSSLHVSWKQMKFSLRDLRPCDGCITVAHAKVTPGASARFTDKCGLKKWCENQSGF